MIATIGSGAIAIISLNHMMIYTFTESGAGHANDDAIAHQSHPAAGDFRLCALADGQGGRSGGGKAAGLAVSLAIDSACAMAPDALLMPSTWPDLCASWIGVWLPTILLRPRACHLSFADSRN